MADKVIPVKVALRIRPLVSREKADGCAECLRTVSGEPQVILGKDKAFTYDFIFSQNTPQIDVYESSVQPLLYHLFKGYNATVLAYGQTGSGKTYSMGSGYQSLYSALNDNNLNEFNINDLDDVGIIPRVLTDLFTRIEEEQRQNNSKFNVKVSFVEVYNEEIKDLFNSKVNSEPLNIREENNSIRVVNLSEIEVNDAISTLKLLEKGSSLRVVGGTAMNDQSSRSHAIFTITLEQNKQEENESIRSKFHLVDLAGSERQSKTKAEGLRLKEGININLGLLALGNVISVLGEDNPTNKVRHVPYRESKLTRLLQDSLGGNSHTVMIACVSPADSNIEETLNTLRYADRARKIKNKPIVNIDPQAAEVARLRQECQELKAQLIQLTGGTHLTSSTNLCFNSTEINQLKDENEKLRIENSNLLCELQRLIKVNRINIERLTELDEQKEEFKKRFEDAKAILEKINKERVEASQAAANGTIIHSENSNSNSADAINQTYNSANINKTLLDELQSKLNEFDQLKEKDQSKIMQEAEQELNTDNASEPFDRDYALRQAKMQYQLTEYDSELAKKEMLFKKMRENNDFKLVINMEELKAKIEMLEKEKEELCETLRCTEVSTKKQNEQKRDRLKQLETEVLDMRRKEKELVKMIKLKEENEKHCEKLRQEITHIKQERVKLLKQMRADADSFRKFRQEKEKEVNQLKALERKRLVEISKLQEGNTRQEAVLRRKNEEISRIQKQLRETGEKQKQVAEKRQQAFDRKDSSTLGEKLRQWITQELDLSVNIAEARMNLNKLIDERKESAMELTRLTEKLEEIKEEQILQQPTAPKQRKFIDMDSTYITGSGSNIKENITLPNAEDQEASAQAKADLELRIERLKEDIECKNIQINEIQQMVIEGDQDEKTKHIFNNVHGLLEAKVLLKHLYNSGVQFLLDSKLKQAQYETNTSSLTQELKDIKKKLDQKEEEFNKVKKTLNKDINDLTQYYEQRILYIMKQVLENPECKNDERYDILFEQLQNVEKKLDKDINQMQPPMSLPMNSSAYQNKRGIHFNSENRLKDEFKRQQKMKRDHRRTRVIKTVPEIDGNLVEMGNAEGCATTYQADEPNDRIGSSNLTGSHLMNVTNVIGETINEYSPSLMSPYNINDSIDDRIHDPDWSKTPVRVKPRTSKRVSIKRM